ncbi:MAG: replication initiation factor domain-containing protein, partial [Oscillospiraceae bacterium]
ERGLTDGSHWVRVELQLRRDRALQFVLADGDIGSRFCGVLLNYVRYVEPNELDSNKWRWALMPYWADLVESALAISLYVKPGTDYNMMNMTNYVYNQAGNAIDATIQILGIEAFLDELHQRRSKPNPKYLTIIEESNMLKRSVKDE